MATKKVRFSLKGINIKPIKVDTNDTLSLSMCVHTHDYEAAKILLLKKRKSSLSAPSHPGKQTEKQQLTGPWRLQSSRSILPLESLESGF